MVFGRLSGIQIASLALGAALCGYGIYDLANPRAHLVTSTPQRYSRHLPKGPVYVTENETRLGGLLSVGFGLGVVALGLSVPSARRRRFDRHGRVLPDGESEAEQ